MPRLVNKFYPIIKGIYEEEGNNVKAKEFFGGRVKQVKVGSAPVSPLVLSFVQKVLDCHVI